MSRGRAGARRTPGVAAPPSASACRQTAALPGAARSGGGVGLTYRPLPRPRRPGAVAGRVTAHQDAALLELEQPLTGGTLHHLVPGPGGRFGQVLRGPADHVVDHVGLAPAVELGGQPLRDVRQAVDHDRSVSSPVRRSVTRRAREARTCGPWVPLHASDHAEVAAGDRPARASARGPQAEPVALLARPAGHGPQGELFVVPTPAPGWEALTTPEKIRGPVETTSRAARRCTTWAATSAARSPALLEVVALPLPRSGRSGISTHGWTGGQRPRTRRVGSARAEPEDAAGGARRGPYRGQPNSNAAVPVRGSVMS